MQSKNSCPENFTYKAACDRHEVRPGRIRRRGCCAMRLPLSKPVAPLMRRRMVRHQGRSGRWLLSTSFGSSRSMLTPQYGPNFRRFQQGEPAKLLSTVDARCLPPIPEHTSEGEQARYSEFGISGRVSARAYLAHAEHESRRDECQYSPEDPSVEQSASCHGPHFIALPAGPGHWYLKAVAI